MNKARKPWHLPTAGSNPASHRKFVELSPTCRVEVEVVFDKPVCFWEAPTIRQSWSEKELEGELEVSATWDELFFDLVIVASIGQIAGVLRWGEAEEAHRRLGEEEQVGNWTKVLHFVLQMLSVYHVWSACTAFNSRVRTNSISHTLRLILKMVAIAGMGANSSPTLEALSQFFAFACFAWIMEVRMYEERSDELRERVFMGSRRPAPTLLNVMSPLPTPTQVLTPSIQPLCDSLRSSQLQSALEVIVFCLWRGDERLKAYTRQTGLFACTLLLSATMFAILSASAAAPGASLDNIYAWFTVAFFLGPAQSPTTYTMFMGRFLTRVGCFQPFNQKEQGVPMNVRYITER